MNNNGKQIFIPPLLSEVKNFIEENNLNVDANYWYAYYQDRKWLANGKPIKNWKGLIINWHKTQFDDKADESKNTTAYGEVLENDEIIYEETDLEALCLSLFGQEKGQKIWNDWVKRLEEEKKKGS